MTLPLVDRMTERQGHSIHAGFCATHSPYEKPIVLIPGTMDDLDELVVMAEYWLKQNRVDPPVRYTDQDSQLWLVFWPSPDRDQC